MIRLGIARKFGKDLPKYIENISNNNIDAYEMGFAYGVPDSIPNSTLRLAEEKNVLLSGHLPFWINLGNLSNIEKNVKYLIDGIKIAEILKSTVVFHLGFYGKSDFKDILPNILLCFEQAFEQFPLRNGRIGIETTGKKKAIGTVDEIIEIINLINNPNVVPIIDWSHIFARSNGQAANGYLGFSTILQQFEDNCKLIPDYFHGGSVIYENGNEKKHQSARFFSPSMPSLLDVLEERGYHDYTMIIESPDSINDVNWLKKMKGDKAMFKFNYGKQHFYFEGDNINIPDYPLTVTLQINRKCNLKCIYCSECKQLEDLPYENALQILDKLKGVNRIIISGGEPLLHQDLLPILKACRERFEVVAMATNAVLMTPEIAGQIVKYVDYFDITIDGPRKIHNNIRGKYDEIIQGIINLKNANGSFSIVTVLFEDNKDVIDIVLTIADTFGAEKLKILSPIPKGKGIAIASERLDSCAIDEVFQKLKSIKELYGIHTKIVMTDWDKIKEGHAILIHPDGTVVASPVWSKDGCIDIIGNINESSIEELWGKYPYKENHIKKYIEKTMKVY